MRTAFLRVVLFSLVAAVLGGCGGKGHGGVVPPVQSGGGRQAKATTGTPAFVQQANGAPWAASTITVRFTTAPAAGDTLVVFFNNNGNTSGGANTYTAPTGWSQIDVDTSHAYQTFQSFYHVVGSGESNSYVFTSSCACRQTVWIAAEYSGVNTTAPIDQHGFAFINQTTAFTTPSVTPSQANDLAAVAMMPTTNGKTWTNASGWTRDVGPLSSWSGELLHELQAGTSPVAEASTLSGSSVGYAAIVLLAPGSATSTPPPTPTPAPTATPTPGGGGGGAATFVQQTSAAPFAPSTITVRFGIAPAVGDTLVVSFNNNGNTSGGANTYTAPTGWSQIDVDTSHAYQTFESFYHVVGSGESNSYVFTPSCACRQTVWIAAEYSGVNTTAPIDRHGFAFINQTTAFTTPSETPSQAGDLAAVAMMPTTSGRTWTNASGWTVDTGPLSSWSGELLHESQGGTSAVSEASMLSGSSVGYAAIVLLAPGSASATPTPAPTSSPPPGSYSDWNTFGYDLPRSGYNPNEKTLSNGNVSGLHLSWKANLGGAITAQAIVAAAVTISGTPTNVVYIGAENGAFYALNADTGAILWQKQLGVVSTGCNDLPNGQFGITGTATFDRATSRVYVADGQDQVHALDMSTGSEAAGWPVTIASPSSLNHMYGALTYNPANHLLYAETASVCDNPTWQGRIVAINTTTASIVATLFPAAPPGATAYNGAGIWGMGGASIDPATNDVYVATGNDESAPSESTNYGDAVVQFDQTLNVLAFNSATIVEPDQDFGATPMVYQMPGCPTQITVKNKAGVLLTYNVNSISSGPVQSIQMSPPNNNEGTFIGVTGFSPITDLVYVGNPSDNGNFGHGLYAMKEQGACGGLTTGWKQTIGTSTTANDNEGVSIANGVVYFTDGIGNQVFAFDAATGAQLWSSGSTIGQPVFAAPTIDTHVYIGAWDNTLYAFGL